MRARVRVRVCVRMRVCVRVSHTRIPPQSNLGRDEVGVLLHCECLRPGRVDNWPPKYEYSRRSPESAILTPSGITIPLYAVQCPIHAPSNRKRCGGCFPRASDFQEERAPIHKDTAKTPGHGRHRLRSFFGSKLAQQITCSKPSWRSLQCASRRTCAFRAVSRLSLYFLK